MILWIDVALIIESVWMLSLCIGIYTAAFELWKEGQPQRWMDKYDVQPVEAVEVPPGGNLRLDVAFEVETGEPLEPAWVSIFDAEGRYQKRVLCILHKKEEEKRKWLRQWNQWWKSKVRKSAL